VVDLGCTQRQAEELHAHDAQGNDKPQHHGEFGGNLSTRGPMHEIRVL
jgi:hypothetical protein